MSSVKEVAGVVGADVNEEVELVREDGDAGLEAVSVDRGMVE